MKNRRVRELATPQQDQSGTGESLTPPLAESKSRRLSDSPIQKPAPRLGESESRHLPESGSHFSITNISANLKLELDRLER